MRIGIGGAGNVGRAIGVGWTAKGHDVVYGVRDPSGSADQKRSRKVADAAVDAEVVVLAVMFHSVEAALRDCGDLSGKILIDPTNPLAVDEGGLKLAIGFETSSAEFVAARTAATVVKTLNQVGTAVLGSASAYSTRSSSSPATTLKQSGLWRGLWKTSDLKSLMRDLLKRRDCLSRWLWSGSISRCDMAWTPAAPGP